MPKDQDEGPLKLGSAFKLSFTFFSKPSQWTNDFWKGYKAPSRKDPLSAQKRPRMPEILIRAHEAQSAKDYLSEKERQRDGQQLAT